MVNKNLKATFVLIIFQSLLPETNLPYSQLIDVSKLFNSNNLTDTIQTVEQLSSKHLLVQIQH